LNYQLRFRALSIESVLNLLRTKLPQQYALAEVVGKWVQLDVSPKRKPAIAKMALGTWLLQEPPPLCLAASVRKVSPGWMSSH
jgi:hypothetical protein